ncbi:hypothetical protein HMPREF9969_0742 [Prevotella sp. oral taxon 306 str. F0472]|nr:hypothetical protein HMPREF9969_0742 [Prevotella sp. oral taxon 306 str. F0472]
MGISRISAICDKNASAKGDVTNQYVLLLLCLEHPFVSLAP